MRLLLAALMASLLAVGLACGQDEEPLPPDAAVSPTPHATESEPQTGFKPTPFVPTPTPGTYLWRWADVILAVPDAPDVLVRTESTPSGSPGIRLTRGETQRGGDGFSTVHIDATDGSIISSEIQPEDRAVIDGILDTHVVSPLDTASAPWPYDGEPPPTTERAVRAGLSFLVPSAETGWHTYSGIGDPCCDFIGMRNWRSTAGAYIDPKTGDIVVEFPKVTEEDRAPLERWLATVKICGAEIQC